MTLKSLIISILIILSTAAVAPAYTLYQASTAPGVTLSNTGTRTSFSSSDWIHVASGRRYTLAYIWSAPFNLIVTSAPSTVTLTRSGGTETAVATISYRMMSNNYPVSTSDGVSAGLGQAASSSDTSYWGISAIITNITFTQAPVAGSYVSATQTYSILDGTTKSITFTVGCNVQNSAFTISEMKPLSISLTPKTPLNPSCAGSTITVTGSNPCFAQRSSTSADLGVISVVYPAGAGNVSVRMIPNGGNGITSDGIANVLTSGSGSTISWTSHVRISQLIASTDLSTVLSSCTLQGGTVAEVPSGTAGGISSFNSKASGNYSFCWGLGVYGNSGFPDSMTFSTAAPGTYSATYTVLIDTY